MRKWLFGLLGALSALSVSTAHADVSIFTLTSGSTCKDRSRAEFGSWRCPGPGGYVAEFGDEGNLAAISVWMPSKRRRATQFITWRGIGRVFGEKLQWRVNNGRPVAAILRIWRADTKSGGEERELEELIVLKIAREGSCRVASTDARQRGANEIAERQSEGADALPCLDDW
jgi:hypothetical protein